MLGPDKRGSRFPQVTGRPGVTISPENRAEASHLTSLQQQIVVASDQVVMRTRLCMQ